MRHALVFHPEAVEDLNSIYDYIARNAGAAIALDYVRGARTFLIELCEFPQRGTIREGAIPGLRIIGYRKTLSIAFSVRADKIVILGLYYAGRNIDSERLIARHSQTRSSHRLTASPHSPPCR